MESVLAHHHRRQKDALLQSEKGYFKDTLMRYLKWVIPPTLLVFVFLAVALSSQSSETQHRLDDLKFAMENNDPDVRLGAIVELTSYGESAVPVLKTALKDNDAKIKEAGMKALAKIGGANAADALAELLTDHDRLVRTRTILLLPSAGRPAFPHLLKALEMDPFPRSRMFAAYGITRLARAGDAPEILKRFERQDKATQMHLVIALVKIGDDEAFAGLHHLIQTGDPLVRFYVANTIAEVPDKQAFPILIEAMDDEASEVRMWAIFGLEKLNLPESYPIVLAALNDDSFYVRKEAAYTLGTLGNNAAVPHLIPFLKDDHYLVRSNAAGALGMLGDSQVIPEIMPLLAEESEAVQIQAAEALAHLNDYSGMEKLISIVDSPYQLYRKQSREALRRISNKDFGEDREAWSRWWEQAKQAIGQSRPEGPED